MFEWWYVQTNNGFWDKIFFRCKKYSNCYCLMSFERYLLEWEKNISQCQVTSLGMVSSVPKGIFFWTEKILSQKTTFWILSQKTFWDGDIRTPVGTGIVPQVLLGQKLDFFFPKKQVCCSNTTRNICIATWAFKLPILPSLKLTFVHRFKRFINIMFKNFDGILSTLCWLTSLLTFYFYGAQNA